MTKFEEFAKEVFIIINNGVDPFSALENQIVIKNEDLKTIFDLILDFIRQLVEIWSENCQQRAFSKRIRSAGPFQEMKARSEWNRLVRRNRIQTSITGYVVVSAAQKVASNKEDRWLDAMATEITKPDWNVI